MWHRSLASTHEFPGGDGTRLRELLHGPKDHVAARYSIAHARLAQGVTSRLHRLTSSEVYYILAGRGRMEIDSDTRDVQIGDTIYIPPQASQRITALGPDDLEFLCIVDPAWRPEDEKILAE
jgi:mannose-6-phosphate isomerase-like protein (cupin superfamily)